MAKETQQYKNKALALYSENNPYRKIAEILAREHKRPVVHFSTICHWVKAEKLSREALQQSDEINKEEES